MRFELTRAQDRVRLYCVVYEDERPVRAAAGVVFRGREHPEQEMRHAGVVERTRGPVEGDADAGRSWS